MVSRKRTKKGCNICKRDVVKRTVKYLSVCNDPKISRSIIRKAPDSVIKTISNAALNVAHGDVHLTESQKRLLAKHRAKIVSLTSPTTSLVQKRRRLQTGGAFFLPAILAPAIATLGSLLLPKILGNRDE